MSHAILCRQHGLPELLDWAETVVHTPGAGEVLVRAAAVNFPDTLIIANRYQFKPELPFTPGGELAGVVESVGPGVANIKPGDRIAATLLWGGFAEQVIVKAKQVVHLPDAVEFSDGCALLLTYGTAYYALRNRCALQPGDVMLVLGAAGGTGLAAVQLGKLLGATVVAAASTEDKLAVCRQHGADHTVLYTGEDLRARLKDITGGRGVDIVFDPVGGEMTEQALRSLAWGGRLAVVGFAGGSIPALPANLLLLKGAAAVGVFYGSFVDREPVDNALLVGELMDWLAAGRLRPAISAVYRMRNAARALDDLASRRSTGKVILITPAGEADLHQPIIEAETT